MKYWLLKSEPNVWSIENQKKAKNGMKIQLTKKVYKLSEIVVESGLKN